MKRLRRWALPVAMAAALLTLGSCLLSTDGDVIKGGIMLEVGMSPRSITVTEFEVSDLRIEIYDPEWNFMEEVWWNVDGPPVVHTVYVYHPGDYQVMVTHYGQFEGEPYEVTEGAIVPIRGRVITRVSIVPGMIGTIEVGEGEPPEPCEVPVYDPPDTPELYGTWVGYVDFPTGGDPMTMWIELTYDPSGFAQNLVFYAEGDPDWVGDMSMQGVYTGADGFIEGTWTHSWWDGAWHQLCPMIGWTADYTGISDPWFFPVDFDQDGLVDAWWELHRAP